MVISIDVSNTLVGAGLNSSIHVSNVGSVTKNISIVALSPANTRRVLANVQLDPGQHTIVQNFEAQLNIEGIYSIIAEENNITLAGGNIIVNLINSGSPVSLPARQAYRVMASIGFNYFGGIYVTQNLPRSYLPTFYYVEDASGNFDVLTNAEIIRNESVRLGKTPLRISEQYEFNSQTDLARYLLHFTYPILARTVNISALNPHQVITFSIPYLMTLLRGQGVVNMEVRNMTIYVDRLVKGGLPMLALGAILVGVGAVAGGVVGYLTAQRKEVSSNETVKAVAEAGRVNTRASIDALITLVDSLDSSVFTRDKNEVKQELERLKSTAMEDYKVIESIYTAENRAEISWGDKILYGLAGATAVTLLRDILGKGEK